MRTISLRPTPAPRGREQLGGLLVEVARTWRNRLDQRLRPLGLSQAKWLALLHLYKQGDGLMQRALAEQIGVEGPTLVGLLDRMAADGWIERRPLAEDRRCKTVHLTEKALTVTREITAIAAELRGELLAGAAEEDIAATLRLLNHIRQQAERLSATDDGGTP